MVTRLPQVPKGPYCYTGQREQRCPYWERIGQDMARCNLLNAQDEVPRDMTLLWDQVKLCDINWKIGVDDEDAT